jgi:hypothetical protein
MMLIEIPDKPVSGAFNQPTIEERVLHYKDTLRAFLEHCQERRVIDCITVESSDLDHRVDVRPNDPTRTARVLEKDRPKRLGFVHELLKGTSECTRVDRRLDLDGERHVVERRRRVQSLSSPDQLFAGGQFSDESVSRRPVEPGEPAYVYTLVQRRHCIWLGSIVVSEL